MKINSNLFNKKIKLFIMDSNWTKEEFKAYVLLYAAQSNYIETATESDYILSKVNEKTFNHSLAHLALA